MLALLLPSRCPVCRRTVPPRVGPCEDCAEAVPPPPALAPPAGVDACFSVCAYDGAGLALVAALKFRGERGVARWAAAKLAPAVLNVGLDVVTWVPTSDRRRRRRGVDQAELLARALGRVTAVPVRSLLDRHPGPPQEGRSAAQRRAGPRFDCAAAPARVVVVDDVVTTGASVRAAADAIRAAGAERVVVAALARTPPGRHTRW